MALLMSMVVVMPLVSVQAQEVQIDTAPPPALRHAAPLTISVEAMLALAEGRPSPLAPSATPAADAEADAPMLVNVPLFGAYTYGGVWQGMDAIYALEAELGRRLEVVHWFMNWDHAYDPRLVAAASQGGRRPMISWQPHRQSLVDIAAGRYDDYIRSWAVGVKQAPGLVYLRPFPEMNGSWVSWNGDPDSFRLAWRQVADIFREEGAHNVRWVFSPNVTDEPRTEANRMEHYYPGSDVVDILALDGYNWGSTREHIGWRSFDDIFSTGYDRITQLGSQPLWIAEVASAPDGGDKAAWVHDMLTSTAFPRVEALVWFNEDKEADWRLHADPAVVQAARAVLAMVTVASTH